MSPEMSDRERVPFVGETDPNKIRQHAENWKRQRLQCDPDWVLYLCARLAEARQEQHEHTKAALIEVYRKDMYLPGDMESLTLADTDPKP